MHAHGGQVLDLARIATTYDGVGPQCGATAIAVDPGPYVLRLEVGDLQLAQIVYASAQWQTQVFLPTRVYPRIDRMSYPDLERGAILMGRGQGNDLASEHSRLAELARLALVAQRRIARDELRTALAYKFEDPLLGILGAHLLLMGPDPDYSLLGIVRRNLVERLHQEAHPDVQALALAPGLEIQDPPYVFRTPPMLRASWALILQSSVRRPERVPGDSLAARAAGRLWTSQPWLVWRGGESDEDRDRRLERAIDTFQTSQAFFETVVGERRRPDNMPAANLESLSTQSVAPALLEGLVNSLGVPRAHVEALLRRNPKTDVR
jgi:hypothetical protein